MVPRRRTVSVSSESRNGFSHKRGRHSEKNDGDDADDPKNQVWAFGLTRGGDARQITDFDEGVREFDWGPEGERLVFSARDPTEEQNSYLERRRQEDGPIEVTRLQHKRDGAGWLEDVTTYLLVGNLPDTVAGVSVPAHPAVTINGTTIHAVTFPVEIKLRFKTQVNKLINRVLSPAFGGR